MPLHVSSTRAYRQEAKIVLYNLWYHHGMHSIQSSLNLCIGQPPTGVMIPEVV
jgi:hypothetical protein